MRFSQQFFKVTRDHGHIGAVASALNVERTTSWQTGDVQELRPASMQAKVKSPPALSFVKNFGLPGPSIV